MPRSARRGKQWRRMWDLFHQAVEREASARDAFLEEACGGNRELRRQVARLLAGHETAEGVLERPLVVGLAVTEEAVSPESGDSAEAESGAKLEPGEVLADRFEIRRLIGQGGMGVVYAAFDRELEDTVALKILRPEIARTFAALDRFHTEINLARRVTHPNACRIFDLFRHGDDLVFLTMELLGGETLADRIRREGPMGTDEALPIVEQVAAALAAAHRVGVVHRDLKGTNVMLVAEDDATRAVVTDFGLATTPLQEESALELSRTGELLGTPAFMAPEQLTRSRVSPVTDVYALGLVIYQMLTGQLPFEGDTPYEVAARRLREEAPSPRKVQPDLDPRWERTILRCLERQPEDRFQSPAEVVEALRAETVALPPSRKRRRRRRFGLAAAAAAVSLAAWLLLPQHWIGPQDGKAGVAVSVAEALAFQERDWVLITAFENRTGEVLLEGTVEAALGRELANSRFVNVVPRARIGDTLRLMRRPPDSVVDSGLGREVALRDGGIRALLTGRVDRLGSTYLMGVELVNPSDGIVVESVSEEAAGHDEVLPAVRRLSNEVRRLLGERLIDIRRTEEELANVTTPSLHALRLYTRADLLLQASMRAEGAEELLRQAIAADPGFASAYIQLARVVWYKERACLAECTSLSERAAELADTVTAPERYFILGKYHQLRSEPEEAEANYRALLQIDPNHFWGLWNLVNLLTVYLERADEAFPLVMHRARLRPNHFGSNAAAAFWALRFSGLEKADPHFVRLAELEPSWKPTDEGAAMVDAYWAHKAWVEGDLDKVLSKVEGWARSLPALTGRARVWLVDFAASYCVYLGKLDAAEEFYRQFTDPVRREFYLLSVELDRGDRDHRREVLQQRPFPPPHTWGESKPVNLEGYHLWGALELAHAGLVEEARGMLSVMPQDERGIWNGTWIHPGLRKVVRGELALIEGKTEEAIALLQEGTVTLLRAGHCDGFYFSGAEALAQAWEERGDLGSAARILEDASAKKERAYFGKTAWMAVQLRLARLYRKLGRAADAREIEDELRQLLVHSDPDYWILLQLERQSEGVAAASSP